MIRHLQWLVVLLWGATGWFAFQSSVVGQDLLVANNTTGFNSSIFRFSTGGELQRNFAPWELTGGVAGLAANAAGELFVANHRESTIYRFSIYGENLGVFAATGLNAPTGIACDSRGRLVVCNFGDGSLSIFSPSGELLARITTGLINPIALTLDSADNIYVSAPNLGPQAGVYRFAAEDWQRTLFATGNDFDPRGLALDHAGNLYVADQQGNAVRRFDAAGNFLDTFASVGLSDPFALAFNPDGELFVANQFGGTIRRYSAIGDALGEFVVTSAPANLVSLLFVPVPEPAASSFALVAGLIGLLFRRRQSD